MTFMAQKPKKPNMTVTSRFFHDKSREGSREMANPFPNPPAGRSAIGRLTSRGPSPKLDWTTPDLVNYINGTLPDAAFFPDTSIFTRDLDPAIWHALRTRRTLIVPGIGRELTPWLKNPFSNKAVRDRVASAMKVGLGIAAEVPRATDGIELLIPDEEFAKHGYNYYLNLLALRKMMGPLATAVLAKRLGRPPSQEEFHAEVQRQFGERGYLLAKKGLEAQNSSNKLTDEHLVVTAMLNAILTGSEAVIVTRDPDVLEQFAKLCTLMKEHYRATLAAERYSSNPSAYAFEEVPLVDDNFCARFSGGSVLRFETTDGEFNPLPAKFHFVMIYCLLIGGAQDNMKVTASSFCAETEMAHALRVKATTSGLTTDKFGGRTCIILTEHITPEKQKVIVLIGNERRAQFGDFTPGVDDVHNTLRPNEISMRVRYAVGGGQQQLVDGRFMPCFGLSSAVRGLVKKPRLATGPLILTDS
jgi:hypothetical protein